MIQILSMAFRDLGRNRRRSFFSALAVAMGLALLMLLAGFVNGEMGGAVDTAVRLQSGHLQVRANNYDENKTSLKWEDLVQDPEQVAAQIAAFPQVKAATPRLFASGIAVVGDKSAGVRVLGIDPASVANDPYREGLLSGKFLAADDNSGVLIGQPLADKLGLKTDDMFSLSVNTSNGDVDEQPFTVRGIYSTQTSSFDGVTVFMPLAKAQAITQTEKHASTIFILLKDAAQTDAVAASLKSPTLQILTCEQIVNTLIMAVFERTREIGILMAIGMRAGRIMAMFLTESAFLAVGGILIGLVLGGLAVAYFTTVGFHIGNLGYTGILLSDTIRANLTLAATVNLSALTFIITLLAGLYPAWMASHMQPVEALHGGN